VRIAYITETLAKGVGRHVTDAARALAARGHEIHVLHGCRRVDAPFLAALRDTPGVRLAALDLRRAPHPSDLPALVRVARYLRRYGPFDVVHGHSSKGGVHARLAGRVHGARCYYTPHALVTFAPGLRRHERVLYTAVERALAHLSTAVVCVSEAERRHALGIGMPPSRLVCVPNGLDPVPPPSPPLPAPAVPPGQLALGFVGRLEEQKGADLLIEAVIALRKRGAAVHTLIAGDGPLRGALAARLAAAGAADAVTWLGEVDGRALMRSLDVLVLPSRYEGFPYVLLEALHARLPVVCTAVGGVEETVRDGENGRVVPADPAAIAAAVQELADPHLRERMCEAAARRAAHFTVAVMTEHLLELYSGKPPVPSGIGL
jgi:glycosyltransferase involved in cell wall biosynthesis